MNGGIFLIQSSGDLVEMREHDYDSEDVLQQLLARYPNLLAGDQMDDTAPRRWLMVSREMGVPCDQEGTDRWSLDHLFLDQDAIPTLIEVKRSSDTRIRREVVGQMLDYSANAVIYWPVEAIRAKYEQGCQQRGADPGEELGAFLRSETGVDEFWGKVKVNLQAGRVRMVFVADEIPTELRRIVEFLNGQMDPAEVLAVEIKQYVGQGLKTLVPRVIGQTSEATRKKSPGREVRQWDEPSFLEALTQKQGSEDARVARAMMDWAKKSGLSISWGKGAKDGSVSLMLEWQGTRHSIISVWTSGFVEIQFQMMKERPPFDHEAKRNELRAKLNLIPGVEIPADAITVRPRIYLSTLNDDATLTHFLDALGWFVEEVKAT
jgi:hypothetical protein